MVQKVQGVQDGEFLISEANGHQSRENMTVKVGEVLPAGQVCELDTGFLVPLAAGTAVGILWAAVDATDAATAAAVIVRDAEVSTDLLTDWGGTAATDLPSIILRTV